ncbi:hypothetical protein [Sphingobacterium sp. G1-14]|uniref:hypothetical protein n=1 Tax=Sphingobacterium sp. G1-14 TaxID=2003121 RepID=UPI000B48AA35|nr:hypothetical protein [Sphingobacterium sp. G1-14]
MDGFRSFFDSFKEFIWDIIGYLIPGLYLVILVLFFTNESYNIAIPAFFHGNEIVILIVISYVLGYIIYGLGDLKEKIRGNNSYNKRILSPISSSIVFKESKRLMGEKDPKQESFNKDLETIDVRGLRNIVMSYVPEADQKIYTFTFRSELSRHTGLVSLIIGCLGIIFTLINCKWSQIDLFKTGTTYILFYLLLVGAYFLLREPRDKFYRIAMTMHA